MKSRQCPVLFNNLSLEGRRQGDTKQALQKKETSGELAKEKGESKDAVSKDGPTMKDKRAQQITLLTVFCFVSVEVEGGRLEEEGG